MKILKTAFLGMTFILGIAATASADVTSNGDAEEVKEQVPCSTVFTVCDNAHPDSFEDFDNCMQANGC